MSHNIIYLVICIITISLTTVICVLFVMLFSLKDKVNKINSRSFRNYGMCQDIVGDVSDLILESKDNQERIGRINKYIDDMAYKKVNEKLPKMTFYPPTEF